ncbi:Glutamine synthetase type I [Richelia intracellularis HM01]|nr:Glutamine synthetase type I [Richelia intracellularis HM01]
MTTPQEILSMLGDEKIKMVDLKFVDMPGTWQHLTLYYNQIDEISLQMAYLLMVLAFGVESYK